MPEGGRRKRREGIRERKRKEEREMKRKRSRSHTLSGVARGETWPCG
jgi:hypothetical protein